MRTPFESDSFLKIYRRFCFFWFWITAGVTMCGTFAIFAQLSLNFYIGQTISFIFGLCAVLVTVITIRGWDVLKTLRPKQFYLTLGSGEFECLVRGGVLSLNDSYNGAKFKIILKDIGFDHMEILLDKAINQENIYEPLEMEIRC